MPIVNYKGSLIVFTEYIPARNEYALFDLQENLVDVITLEDYLSHPDLMYIGNSHGRYRQPSSQIYFGSAGKSNRNIPAGAFVVPNPVGGPGWVTIAVNSIYVTCDGTIEPEDAGIRAGEVTGERCWWCVNDRLFSVYMTQFEWKPGIPMSGEVSKGVGVHAFKNKEDLYDYGGEVVQFIGQHPNYAFNKRDGAYLVGGKIAMWGEIMEHERGYRSEFAKIIHLETNDLRLRRRYGV
jgi:hypothetical protein